MGRLAQIWMFLVVMASRHRFVFAADAIFVDGTCTAVLNTANQLEVCSPFGNLILCALDLGDEEASVLCRQFRQNFTASCDCDAATGSFETYTGAIAVSQISRKECTGTEVTWNDCATTTGGQTCNAGQAFHVTCAPSAAWGEWGSWGACCGTETQTRTRYCSDPQNNGAACSGSGVDTRECMDAPCDTCPWNTNFLSADGRGVVCFPFGPLQCPRGYACRRIYTQPKFCCGRNGTESTGYSSTQCNIASIDGTTDYYTPCKKDEDCPSGFDRCLRAGRCCPYRRRSVRVRRSGNQRRRNRGR